MNFNYNLTESSQSALHEIIETASRTIASNYLPIYYQQQIIGHLSPTTFKFIDECINNEQNEFSLVQLNHDAMIIAYGSSHDISIELRIIAEYLRSKNIMSHWRNENFSFFRDDLHELFQLERAAFRIFGFLSQAVHVNGFDRKGNIWLAKRSDTKSIDPGLFDNITAGGISANETIQTCVTRELWEEAGISSTQLKNLIPISTLEIKRPLPPNEIHHERIYTFDLFLEDEFEPQNQDGEVFQFKKCRVEEVIELIMADKMTKDAALVTADFILRHKTEFSTTPSAKNASRNQ